MSSENVAADIGRAWRNQREGKAEAAIGEFDRILKQDADNIDANYGMGLAQRDVGKKEDAVKYFQHTLELIEAGITARNRGADDRNAPEDDRFMMLARMVKQRLTELTAVAK